MQGQHFPRNRHHRVQKSGVFASKWLQLRSERLNNVRLCSTRPQSQILWQAGCPALTIKSGCPVQTMSGCPVLTMSGCPALTIPPFFFLRLPLLFLFTLVPHSPPPINERDAWRMRWRRLEGRGITCIHAGRKWLRHACSMWS